MTRSNISPDRIPHEGVESLLRGRRFDGVCLPTFVGVRVVSRPRDRSGPIVRDRAAEMVPWLVAPGATDGWERQAPGVDVLRAPRVPAVPPAAWCDGPRSGGSAARWPIPPASTCLTDPARLLGALRHVLRRGTR